jgi:hypothetical protein
MLREFNQVPYKYWRGEIGRKRAIEVVRYMIEEKCKMTHHEIPLRINHRFFKEHGLLGILGSFGDSPYQCLR